MSDGTLVEAELVAGPPATSLGRWWCAPPNPRRPLVMRSRGAAYHPCSLFPQRALAVPRPPWRHPHGKRGVGEGTHSPGETIDGRADRGENQREAEPTSLSTLPE